jgi:hypothetical protein
LTRLIEARKGQLIRWGAAFFEYGQDSFVVNGLVLVKDFRNIFHNCAVYIKQQQLSALENILPIEFQQCRIHTSRFQAKQEYPRRYRCQVRAAGSNSNMYPINVRCSSEFFRGTAIWGRLLSAHMQILAQFFKKTVFSSVSSGNSAVEITVFLLALRNIFLLVLNYRY